MNEASATRIMMLSRFWPVRGPLSRSALRLGETVPIGDPGLLLPALHRPAEVPEPKGAAIVVPHFHDKRSDDELRNLTGCTSVLRPNIPNNIAGIIDFLNRLIAADFVLTGSLHAAIAAAAYGRPFAFWDSGSVDLPFKWHDFRHPSASHVSFKPRWPTRVIITIEISGRRYAFQYLWPLLAVARSPSVRKRSFGLSPTTSIGMASRRYS